MANSNFKSVTFKRVMCNSVLTSCGKRAALIFKICELYGYDQKRNETQLRAYPVHRQPGGGFRLHLLTALSSDGDQQWELFGTIGTTVFQFAGCPCFLNCQEW
jgi:hypothetical protein